MRKALHRLVKRLDDLAGRLLPIRAHDVQCPFDPEKSLIRRDRFLDSVGQEQDQVPGSQGDRKGTGIFCIGLYAQGKPCAFQGVFHVAARIKDKQLREQQAKTASTRKSLIGSGDRSERIRTYNFPQGRVTDHRINLTLHKIDRIMDGELDELVGALSAEHHAEQLMQLAEEAA